MSLRFHLITTAHFEEQAAKLPKETFRQLAKALELLESNPKHPSLHTHEVRGAHGHFGEKIFEAYVSHQYRMTWEYGANKGEILLRNVDNHDECLENP